VIEGSPSWSDIRAQFELDYGKVHLALSMLAAHPACVRQEIETHRKGLDANPALYHRKKDFYSELNLAALARYLGSTSDQIALTESTTAGISVVLNGLDLRPGDEVLSTRHEHYAMDETLKYLARSRGVVRRRISLYEDPASITGPEIHDRILSAISPATRVLCLTWVHSGSGVKLPLRAIAEGLQGVNTARAEAEAILLVVDAVHAMGVEAFVSIGSVGGDFIISGLHKWMFGPRGTGFIWGNDRAWSRFAFPSIVSFDNEAFFPWRYPELDHRPCPAARLASTGGFTAFEHRWAIHRAVEFMEGIGQGRVKCRLRSHLGCLRHCLSTSGRVEWLTPADSELSSGLLCFQVRGTPPGQVVQALLERGVIAGQTPYRTSAVRLAPCLANSDEDIERATRILKDYLNA
jgi:selenocysteine lyase/cysteine desulfurase